MGPAEKLRRVNAYRDLLLITQAKIIAELGKAMGGQFPNETRRAIHELLAPLSEAAIDVPEELSVLRGFELLVALFPPPDS